MDGFSHPLARDAKVWSSGGLAGPPRPLLVVVTSISLSPEQPRFKQRSFDRLTSAVKDWIGANPDTVSDYILINRPKTWAGDKAACGPVGRALACASNLTLKSHGLRPTEEALRRSSRVT